MREQIKMDGYFQPDGEDVNNGVMNVVTALRVVGRCE
jgi:hypothetical protein